MLFLVLVSIELMVLQSELVYSELQTVCYIEEYVLGIKKLQVLLV